MIIFFHSLYFVYKFLCKYYHRLTVLHDFLQHLKQCQELSKKEALAINNESNLESLAVLKFDPPVYLQRYCDVQELLLDVRWGSEMAKIVEFGCAELKLFTYLKRLLYVKEILHVDIDEELLKESLFRVEPLTVDHLQQRSYPLLVQVLAGSVSDPDYRLQGADAVIAIELIEHLYPDTLEALPYNIFSYIRPKIVILTTPNADFNVLFPNFSGMRHHDHKFEWTRSQFQDWCEHIVKRFPQYSVTFQGCGSGPAGSEHFGHCSQMAVFNKNYDRMESEVPIEYCNIIAQSQIAMKQELQELDSSFGICTYYSYSKILEELSASSLSIIGSVKNDIEKCASPEASEVAPQDFYRLVHKIDYPYYADPRSPQEIKLDEALYKIHQARIYRLRYYNEDLNKLEIPVYDLIYNNQGQFSTIAEMSKLLTNAGFTLEQCVCDGSGQPTPCVIQHLDMDSSRTTSISELSDPPTTDDDPTNQPLCPQRLQAVTQEECYWDNVDGAASGKPWNDDPPALASSLHLGAITATITNTTDTADPKPSPGHNSDQLVDSGYQKSITSTAEWSPQSPLQDGMFEEQFLNSCSGGRSPPVDPLLVQQSSTKAEELHVVDRSPPVQKKMFISCAFGVSAGANVVVGKEAVGVACSTAPGTSIAGANGGRKMKKDTKDLTVSRKKPRSKVHDLVEEDVRDLTQCLILNSLNLVPIEEPAVLQSVELSPIVAREPQERFPLIQENQQQDDDLKLLQAEPEVEPVDLINGAPEEIVNLQQHNLPGIVFEPLEVDALIGQGVVENGDLANNNRDLEGNNYPDFELVDVQEHIRRNFNELEDNLNENIENNLDVAIAIDFPIVPQHDIQEDELELANQDEDIANRNNVQNIDEIQPHQLPQEPLDPLLVDLNEIADEQQFHANRLPSPSPPPSVHAIDEPSHSMSHILHQATSADPSELAEVHRASREALFDSDSQIDLLDDVHIPEVAQHDYENVDEVDERGQRPRNIVLVGVNNYDEGAEDPFPLWLLQLLGDDGEQHGEPHFYCQGDGVGVHPSIVEVDIEDDDQSTSSSSADEAEDGAARTVPVNMDELMEQPISLPSSSHEMLNEGFHSLDGPIELEVIGLGVQLPRDYDLQTTTHPSLDTISPRTNIDNIATTTTNLLDLNGSSNSTDRDSSDELFFDTSEDLPLLEKIGKAETACSDVQIGQTAPAPETVVGGSSFRCFEGNSISSADSESAVEYRVD